MGFGVTRSVFDPALKMFRSPVFMDNGSLLLISRRVKVGF